MSTEVTGLTPDTSYSYVLCGKGDNIPTFVCTRAAPTTFTTLLDPAPPPAAIAAIPANCSSDTTAAFNAYFASNPTGTINLPQNACYLISNSPSNFLQLNNVSNLTINGDGATFLETTVTCSNSIQPILNLRSGNTNITINNVTLKGPGTCGGASSEGAYGILLGQATPGNSNITFNGVTVEYTDGDGLAVLPQLGTCCGINTNVTFENGAMTSIGYHAITPEGVAGLSIENNKFTGSSNFMDLEVDNSDGPPYNTCTDTYAQGLTGNAQCNVSIVGNDFVNSSMAVSSQSNGACIPQGNLVIENNTGDANSDFEVSLSGSASSACPQDNGLTIENNNFAGPGKSWCGGSIGTPPAGCSMVEIQDYTNVTIASNQIAADDGNPDYYPNTLYVPCIGMDGDSHVAIVATTCNNAWNLWSYGYTQFPRNDFPNGAVGECGNTWGLTEPVAPTGGTAPPANPQHDGVCNF